mgnify:CR=1 FL=1
MDQRGVGAGRGQHPEGQVDADRAQTPPGQLAAQVAGAARQVEDHRPGPEVERPDRTRDVPAPRPDPGEAECGGRDVADRDQAAGCDPEGGVPARLEALDDLRRDAGRRLELLPA